MTAALHQLLTVLMRIPLTWAFRTAGSAMIDETLADAMREAMLRALKRAMEEAVK